jgi:hypothetical protein
MNITVAQNAQPGFLRSVIARVSILKGISRGRESNPLIPASRDGIQPPIAVDHDALWKREPFRLIDRCHAPIISAVERGREGE